MPNAPLKVGDFVELKKAFTSEDVMHFAELSLDKNPVHLDESYAAQTPFGKRIVHGFLVSSLISAILGTKLPGPGTIYMSQEMKFRKPVYLGDEVTARVEIEEINEAKAIYTLKTTCSVGSTLVIEGKAVIKYMPV